MKSPKNKPEDICKCLHAGTLSECFGGTTISMRVQRQSVVSCFIRHPDGRVTCPMGQELFKHRKREHGTVNGSREARRTCPNRCTDSHKTKPVSIEPSRNIVAVRMYGHPNHPLQQLPPGFQPHNSLGRLQKPACVGDPPAQPGRHAAKKGTDRASLWDGEVV